MPEINVSLGNLLFSAVIFYSARAWSIPVQPGKSSHWAVRHILAELEKWQYFFIFFISRNCCDTQESQLLKSAGDIQSPAQNLWSQQQSAASKNLSDLLCLPSCTAFNHAIFEHLSFIQRGLCNYLMLARGEIHLTGCPPGVFTEPTITCLLLAADAELFGAHVPRPRAGKRLQHQSYHVEEVVGEYFNYWCLQFFPFKHQ